jgi:hypothetical protein
MAGSFANDHSHRRASGRLRDARRALGQDANTNQEGLSMERREFLKVALGFTAAAGAMAAAATAAQAAPMLPPDTSSAPPPKATETAAAQRVNAEPGVQDELNAGEISDTDMSSHRRRRVIFVRRRPRRWWRRRRVIYY